MSGPAPLIRLSGLTKSFRGGGGLLGRQTRTTAVNDVSLDIAKGEVLGVVGESGCGKSTLARIAVGMLAPDQGEVFIAGKPLYDADAHADYRAFRRSLAGTVQMVFQDPYSSLNPRMSIGASIAEPLVCSRAWRGQAQDADAVPLKEAVRQRVRSMLEQVGLEPEAANRYPHEFSGGQRQRVAIARALVTGPAFVVCDEPTSSLDASVQSQVLNLLRDMQADLGLTYMFISHDLAVVRHMSDRVAVMYRGFLVEEGDADTLFRTPAHPYTRLLLDSVPDALILEETGAGNGVENPAGPQDVMAADGGCPFAARCPMVQRECRQTLPGLRPVPTSGNARRLVRCHLFNA